ncbi:hypothetical protein H4582DRAFT_2070118 [Lactarius indigo]|nr:hypothetical protein H4582DRAFT_2070118 [Lactarius indigo]
MSRPRSWVYVVTPDYPNLTMLPFNENLVVAILLHTMWKDMVVRSEEKVRISQLSLRLLHSPVPKEPWNTICKRIGDSARKNGWETVSGGELVSPDWCDPGYFRVYLHIDLGSAAPPPDMQAAEELHETLWGVDYNAILKEISDDQGTTWKYVPESFIESSGMCALGFPECGGLLFRNEYEAAWENFHNDVAKASHCGGVVVTGQLGIGKSCFLYYLLFCLLSKKKPVALQRFNYFFVFQEDGVSRYPFTTDPHHLPRGTWALSDSNNLPCPTFLEAASWGTAWIIQTASPLEQGWKKWKTQRSADIFVMDYFTIEEMTVLGMVLGLNTSDLRRNYERWGPSARTCLRLSRYITTEDEYEKTVEGAAKHFVNDPDAIELDFNMTTTRITHILFSVRPKEKEETGRRIQIADLASDRIKTIISDAATHARAQKRINFYDTISTQPGFEASTVQIFKGFVLSWLHARPNVQPLDCFHAVPGLPNLQIPSCREKQTSYFGSLTALNEVKVDGLPLFLSPTSQTLATVDAIVFTDKFIITIQVTVSRNPSTTGGGSTLADIKKSIPRGIRGDRDWCHMYITDSVNKVNSLRTQTLSDLPNDIRVFYEVFDVGRLDILTHEHLEVFGEKKHPQKKCGCRRK